MSEVPPYSQEAEKGVIGSILVDNSCLPEVVDLIGVDDFYIDNHRVVFRHIVGMSGLIDLVTLFESLTMAQQVDKAGGREFLASLFDVVPTAAEAIHYAKIVRDKSIMRQIVLTCGQIIANVRKPMDSVDGTLADAQREIMKIGSGSARRQVRWLKDILVDVDMEIGRRRQHKASTTGIPTGLVDVDTATGGFHPGELIVLAARPSVGKSALAGNISLHAGRQGFTTLFFSAEQSEMELGFRWVGEDAPVDSYSLRTGKLSNLDLERITISSKRLSPLPVAVDEIHGQQVRHIVASARRLRTQREVHLIVVDYLQLIAADNPRDGRVEQISQMTRGLKLMAKDMKIPVLLLSQLNRDSEQQNRQPRLSDLRESGSIEQDADTVFMLHRPNKQDNLAKTEVIELLIKKQRNGPLDDIKLTFVKETMRFENHAPGIPI